MWREKEEEYVNGEDGDGDGEQNIITEIGGGGTQRKKEIAQTEREREGGREIEPGNGTCDVKCH